MRKKNHYVNNEDLLKEIKEFKKTCKYNDKGKYVMGSGKMSETLGKNIFDIANGLSKRPNFHGYTWRRDMVSSAIVICIKYLHNFNPEIKTNPYGYITMICSRAFLQYIEKQKKHGKIKQKFFENKPKNYFENKEFYHVIGLDYEEIANWENKE